MTPVDQFGILVIENDLAEREAIVRLLAGAGYAVKSTDCAENALSYMGEGIDCVVAGVSSGDLFRMDPLKYRKKLDIEAARDHIIGQSQPMQDIFNIIARSSQAFSTVLILGESGTGKDLVAQAIHRNSQRKDGPFIVANCAAMPEPLVESELFGHEKGTFTGATSTRMGRFEAANGGTLFIDEIGDFALPLQAKLLRVLENRVVTPLGGHRDIKVDTRVVAATSRNIPDMIAKGLFREDLYYRLNVITINMPPLRDRLDDIPLLVRSFIERVNKQNQSSITSIAPPALEALQRYDWPGNVRELLNTIERAMVLSDKTVITVEDLPAEVAHALRPSPQHNGHAISHLSVHQGGPQSIMTLFLPGNGPDPLPTLAELEQQAILSALHRYRNNKTRAAHAIGISVRTLQRKLAGQVTGPEPKVKMKLFLPR